MQQITPKKETTESDANSPNRTISGNIGSPGGQDSKSEESEAVLVKLKVGRLFVKHGRTGKPHQRFVSCSPDMETVRWGKDAWDANTNKKSEKISELADVVPGWTTPVFARYQKDLMKKGKITDQNHKFEEETKCFSLLWKGRSLDLEANSQSERDEWVKAFNFVRQQRHRGVSMPFNVKHVTHVNSNFEWTGDNVPKEFDLQELLGEGAFGQVFRAVHKSSKVELAVKLVEVSEEKVQQIKAEVDFLKKLRNANIVSYYGCWGPDSDMNVWILMELAKQGAVSDLMKKADAVLSEDQVAYVMACALKALLYLHTGKKIVHRDIKAGNLLVTQNGEVKLTDFGISKEVKTQSKSGKFALPAGSPFWMAPEVIKGVQPTYKADIWSLGITAIEIGEGIIPLSDLQPYRAMSEIVRRPSPTFQKPEAYSETFRDFVAKCLVKEVENRPDAMTMLTHPFIINAPKSSDIMLPLVDGKDASQRKRSNAVKPKVVRKLSAVKEAWHAKQKEKRDSQSQSQNSSDGENKAGLPRSSSKSKSKSKSSKPGDSMSSGGSASGDDQGSGDEIGGIKEEDEDQDDEEETKVQDGHGSYQDDQDFDDDDGPTKASPSDGGPSDPLLTKTTKSRKKSSASRKSTLKKGEIPANEASDAGQHPDDPAARCCTCCVIL